MKATVKEKRVTVVLALPDITDEQHLVPKLYSKIMINPAEITIEYRRDMRAGDAWAVREVAVAGHRQTKNGRGVAARTNFFFHDRRGQNRSLFDGDEDRLPEWLVALVEEHTPGGDA